MKPAKPFDTYKWRWLSLQPTESLLRPPIFLGVLRALRNCEGMPPSDQRVFDSLASVEEETKSVANVRLARNPTRNILRNSGQYWKGTGLLTPAQGSIELTALGHKVAEGQVTQGEFAAIMIQQTILPNPITYATDEIRKWNDSGLKIKPLALILEILRYLGEEDLESAYITPNELTKFVIPLAGNKVPGRDIAKAMRDIRNGNLSTEGWPDCVPKANDKRMAKEFLIFLLEYDICRLEKNGTKYDDRYYLDELLDIDAVSTITDESIFSSEKVTENVIDAVRNTSLPSLIERQRTRTTVLSRPGQGSFRKKVLESSNSQCLLTGEKSTSVLEAAHIIPVRSGGNDRKENGICLRVDVHRLFDSGNIRLQHTGELIYSGTVSASRNYRMLPSKIVIPAFVNIANVEWRFKYC